MEISISSIIGIALLIFGIIIAIKAVGVILRIVAFVVVMVAIICLVPNGYEVFHMAEDFFIAMWNKLISLLRIFI